MYLNYPEPCDCAAVGKEQKSLLQLLLLLLLLLPLPLLLLLLLLVLLLLVLLLLLLLLLLYDTQVHRTWLVVSTTVPKSW